MAKLSQAGILVLTTLYLSSTASAEVSYSTVWAQQFGTSSEDRAFAVSADSLGNVFVAGRTSGAMDGTNAGGNDAFFSKFNASGNLLWTRQLGSAFGDEANGIPADASGNIFISGTTERAQNGNKDAFLYKYDSEGMPVWTRQYQVSIYDHRSTRVSSDDLGNAYVAGSSSNLIAFPRPHFNYAAYLRKYDALGNPEWTRSLGAAPNEGTYSGDVSADGLGSVYITGSTLDTLDPDNPNPSLASDAFLSRYDASGNLQWTRQFGTSNYETSNGVAADKSGNVYITGNRRSTQSIADQDIL